MAITVEKHVPSLVQMSANKKENDVITRTPTSFSQVGRTAMNKICSIPSSLRENTFDFTTDDLDRQLYGRKRVKPIDVEEIARKRELLDNDHPSYKKSRILTEDEELDDIEMTYSIMSFPNDVQLCLSSIPGQKLGVCAKDFMPVGTWIGPYEGKRVAEGQLTREKRDSTFCWEIYKDGKLDHFLDGSDGNSSSWMRYIRCARNRFEQNMNMVQYGPNIYYHSFKDIMPGEELLVWYESQYEQYFGIPMFIKLSSFGKKPTNLAINRVSGVPQKKQSEKLHIQQMSPVHKKKHDDFVPHHFPFTVGQALTSSIHYNDWERQNSTDLSMPSISPNGSPMDNNSPVNIEEEKDIGVWKCGQCEQRFTQRSALRLHVCASAANNPFHCGHCNLSFADPTKLRAHVVTHNNERPFKCGFCSRTFAGATTLNNHVRTHTGQKPFTCDKCGKSFSQASQMSRHQRLSEECQ